MDSQLKDVVKNKNLIRLLDKKGFNTDQVWSSISTHEGSVQHLTFLSSHEKDVFKTAYEIDQNWIIRTHIFALQQVSILS